MIRFSSKAGADVWMLDEHGRQLLRLIGRDPDSPRGVLAATELGEAIARLRAAAAEEAPPPEPDPDDAEQQHLASAHVGLRQRAFPLIELMERSQAKGRELMWGW